MRSLFNNQNTSLHFTVDNLVDITKLKAADTSNFLLKTKLTADVNI